MEQTLGSSSQQILPRPIPGGYGLSTEERQRTDRSATIKGWGSDLDPARRPGVPRDKAPGLGAEALYPPIEQQVPRIKIHKSTEHGKLPPVFGTSCPPSGLSGRIRDFGYQFSEGRLSRWLSLMAADRVNVVEDFFNDLVHAHIPNIPKEMGIRAEWRHNRAGLARKAGIVAGCVAAFVIYRRLRRN